jgi:hypothetical protein
VRPAVDGLERRGSLGDAGQVIRTGGILARQLVSPRRWLRMKSEMIDAAHPRKQQRGRPLRRTPARVSRWKPAASQAIDRIHAVVNGIRARHHRGLSEPPGR